MMLVVFTVHNVDPGPTLFTEKPEFISGLYLSLFLMNFVIVAILLVGTKWIALVARINQKILGVTILALVMVGTYTTNYRLTDPLIAVGFGLSGFALRRANIPSVPIILGLVLGPIFETRVRQAIGSAGGDAMVFLERPISAVLLTVIVILVSTSVIGAWRQRRQ